MAWSNVSKPNTSNYMNVNPQGKEQYDQSDITYDSAITFYDGVNMAAWTDVNKPTGGAWINVTKPS